MGSKRGRPPVPAVGRGIVWRALRARRGLTAAQVADEIGAATSTITALERGEKVKVNADFIERASRLFGVPADVLVWTPSKLPPELLRFVKLEGLDASIDPVALAALATYRTFTGDAPTLHDYGTFYQAIRNRLPYVGPLE